MKAEAAVAVVLAAVAADPAVVAAETAVAVDFLVADVHVTKS